MSNQNHDELPQNVEPELITAYALGQLEGEELARVEALLAAGDEAAEREIAAVRAVVGVVSEIEAAEPMPALASGLRQRIQEQLAGGSVQSPKSKVQSREGGPSAERVTIAAGKKPWWRPRIAEVIVVGGLALVFLALLLPASSFSVRRSGEQSAAPVASTASPFDIATIESPEDRFGPLRAEQRYSVADEQLTPEIAKFGFPVDESMKYAGRFQRSVQENEALWEYGGAQAQGEGGYQRMMSARDKLPRGDRIAAAEWEAAQAQAQNDAEVELRKQTGAEYASQDQLSDEQIAWARRLAEKRRAAIALNQSQNGGRTIDTYRVRGDSRRAEGLGTEQYAPIIENRFLSPLQQPLSTFSIDVDTASYANVRRFLNEGRLPPASSVRIEELVNYFRYEYPQPKNDEPFSVNMEVAECPWALTPALSQREREKEALTALSQGEREGKRGHLLLRVGLKGKDVHRSERPASNLVFLLDVSGSMADQNKLPLLKTAMKLLVGELGENDKVSIVTYAGEAGLKLAPTRGHEQAKINRVIDGLSAGGSTNGSAGIELAYEQATAGFIKGGANRVILCTDGDLNVGITSDEALVKLIKKKATSGVFLTVLGFGEGNLKDSKMEKLADNGNGLYAYIDSVREAKKVLVEQLTGSTITIAKDVKIQIEFNPREIASYRLLGYENRVMAAQDFNNDKKDAGEIGAGHTVTALYELVPAGAAEEAGTKSRGVDPLKYQSESSKFKVQSSKSAGGNATLNADPGTLNSAADSGELLTLKLRYKEPDGQTSKLVEYPLSGSGHSFHSASADFQFAAAVASFGMILRGSEHRSSSNLAAVAEIASAALGKDEGGYRAEFVDLVRKAQSLGAQ